MCVLTSSCGPERCYGIIIVFSSISSFQNLLLRLNWCTGGPVSSKHCCKSQPVILSCPGELFFLNTTILFLNTNNSHVIRWLVFLICLCLWLQGYYPSNKPGVEPRRPCRPVNITSWLHLSNASNRVTITWGNFGKVSRKDVLCQYEKHCNRDILFYGE